MRSIRLVRRVAMAAALLLSFAMLPEADAAYRSGVKPGTYSGGRGGVSGIRLFHRSPYEFRGQQSPGVWSSRSRHGRTYRQPTYVPPVYHHPQPVYHAPAPRVIYIR